MSYQYKLNRKFKKILLSLPETGMGYQRVEVIMNNDKKIEGVVLNSETLLTEEKISENMIVDIRIIDKEKL